MPCRENRADSTSALHDEDKRDPQLQCIDESINDSGVRAIQVLIVELSVDGSQLQWDMCSQHLNITIPAAMFIFLIV